MRAIGAGEDTVGLRGGGGAAVALLALALAIVVALAAAGCGHDHADSPTCEGRGEPYVPGIAKTSAAGALTVAITAAVPDPPANSYTNQWTLQITDAAGGAPLLGAVVVASPYMVDHGHGAPGALATEADGGVYLLGPMSLKMNGLWNVTLKVVPSGAGAAEERVMFPFCVRPL